MDLGLRDAVAIISGASTGLGKAVAMGLAHEGCNVAICSRSEENIKRAADEIRNRTKVRVFSSAADVNDPAAIKRFVSNVISELGKINILVTNTGGPPSTLYEETQEEHWDKGLNQTLRSAIRFSNESIPHLKKADFGRIIHIASVSAKEPLKGMVISNVTRAGIAGLSKTMALELAQYGILVNTVCPGFISTNRTIELADKIAARENISAEKVKESFIERVPLGRMGTPEEFADLVVYLASKKASYITGNAIQIDGGRFPGLL